MGRTETWRKGSLLTLIVVAVVSLGAVWCASHRTSITYGREASLRQNLFTLRQVVEEYTVDQHKRPQSLAELVTAGYLKEVPADPMAGRSDSWVVEWSKDPKEPGIVDVHGASHAISSDGTAYCDW